MRLIKTIFAVGLFLLSIHSAWAKPLDQVRTNPLPGTVTLTFDDGPNPKYTPQILAILRKYNVKATFFVMGWAAKKWPDLIHQIVADGNTIADHTISHKMLTKMSEKQLSYEVKDSRDMIASVLGKPPVCLRPPFGAGNKRVGEYIHSKGMIMVPMGFNSFDYERRGVEKLINWVVANAKAGRVILLHDGQEGKEQTVQALPMIIEGIRKKGLGFSTICEP